MQDVYFSPMDRDAARAEKNWIFKHASQHNWLVPGLCKVHDLNPESRNLRETTPDSVIYYLDTEHASKTPDSDQGMLVLIGPPQRIAEDYTIFLVILSQQRKIVSSPQESWGLCDI